MKRDNISKSNTRRNTRKNGWVVATALMLAAGGCQSEQLNQMLNVPTPPPVPTPAPQPKPDFFDANDYIGFKTADGSAPMPGVQMPPGQHRVVAVASPEYLTVQSVSMDKKGRPVLGAVAESVHLGGIISQSPGKPGWQSAVKAVQNWTVLNPRKQTVEVEIDPRFPYDLSGRHMVQVYFNGTTEKTAATRYSLNRMLVRSGWAVVDLHTATAIDLQAWLNDERYAKTKRLGLWGLGVSLQQRDAEPPKNMKREKGRSNIRIESSRPGATGASRDTGTARGTATSSGRPPSAAPTGSTKSAGAARRGSNLSRAEINRLARTGESMTQCKDGTKSFAKNLAGHQDNCASHGGVVVLSGRPR